MVHRIFKYAIWGMLLMAAVVVAQPTTMPTTLQVTLVSPNGGESWALGSKQVIQWKYDGPQPVQFRLLLSTDGGKTYPSTLADSVAGTIREARWTVKGALTSTAVIKVQALLGTSAAPVEDASDAAFSIVAAGQNPQPVITSQLTLLAPNGGEVLHEGHADSVCWRLEGPAPTSYTISVLTDSGATVAPVVIASNIAGDLTCYAWTPNFGQQKPIKNGRLIITATYPTGAVSDTSNSVFMITPSQGKAMPQAKTK